MELIKINPIEFGLNEETATTITKDLTAILNERETLSQQYSEIITLNIEDSNTSKKASELRKLIKNNRTKGIENWHKVNKEFYLRGGQFVDAIKRKEVAESERMESALEEIEKYAENKEKERIAALQAERIELVKTYLDDTTNLQLGTMDEDVFDAYLSAKKKTFEDKKEAERLAEEKRLAELEAERLRIEEQRLENDRLRKENEAKELQLEKERKEAAAKQKAIEDAARKEREEMERVAKEEKSKQDAILAEQKRLADIESKKQADVIAKQQSEIQAKKEAELKAESEHKAAELQAKKKAEKLAKAPVKKQLNVWVDSFKIPELSIKNEKAEEIIAKFNSFKNWAKTQIENL